MKLRIPLAMVAMLYLVGTPTLFAAPFLNRTAPSMPKQIKPHMISFRLRNDSADAITLKAGDQEITLRARETRELKLPLGASLIAENTTAHYAAGVQMATVNETLRGNTLIFH